MTSFSAVSPPWCVCELLSLRREFLYTQCTPYRGCDMHGRTGKDGNHGIYGSADGRVMAMIGGLIFYKVEVHLKEQVHVVCDVKSCEWLQIKNWIVLLKSPIPYLSSTKRVWQDEWVVTNLA